MIAAESVPIGEVGNVFWGQGTNAIQHYKQDSVTTVSVIRK